MFYNTELSFCLKSNKELLKAYHIFRIIQKNWLISFGSLLLKFALFIRFPVKIFVNPFYKHFCGGESLSESLKTTQLLNSKGVKSILDYSIENKHHEKDLHLAYKEILQSIEFASDKSEIPFVVFKLTALIPPVLLEDTEIFLSNCSKNNTIVNKYIERINHICSFASQSNLMVLIDAEDYKYQNTIDAIAKLMMQKHNINKAIIFNTLQMYRKDRLEYLSNLLQHSKNKHYLPGIKLVRGAYMEKERQRALQNKYPSPLFDSKQETDNAFNNALKTIVQHINHCALFCGTHNEESSLVLTELMKQNNIKNNDSRIFFSQLYGMSDHISFNLAHHTYNVAKYIPYGPVKNVIPYLLRRAQENSSVSGQSNRELSLILEELKRRKIR